VNHRAFTLIEMLVATVVATVMTAGVLFVVAGLSRDHAKLSKNASSQSADRMIELLRWDIANAEAMNSSPRGDEIILIGHGGIDPATLSANGRMSRVSYTIERAAGRSRLVREQRYLDDRARPEPWRESVASGVDKLYALPTVTQSPAELPPVLAQLAGRGARQVPARLRIVLQRGGVRTDHELQVQ
jgi:prepilin-type N-terminal cleavage/methylation domain-containing protein